MLIDAANVVGSRPTGWWRDRPGAARSFVERVRASNIERPVVIVLEGQAKRGAPEGDVDGVEVVHARGEGDDALAAIANESAEPIILVSADRGLRARTPTATVVGPSWLLDQLDEEAT